MLKQSDLDLLGLGEYVTPQQAKARFRELSLRHHPDRGGSVAMFAAINSAYKRIMEDITTPKKCLTCGGRGTVVDNGIGFKTVRSRCVQCGGSGKVTRE